MGNYKISVVTPYHNVGHSMFDGCIKSMLAQTIGFAQVEWVIVLHNCDEEHIGAVRERLGGYENVILEVLNNSCCTPSSPRNRGMELSTSDYVAFLDGDDKLRADALERLVGYFEKTHAQILVFRREYELEFPDMLALSETVPMDTTREIIQLNMKDGVENRIYNDFPFFVTSRAFDLNFLKSNHITFDEDFVIAEDCYFNLQTIHLAERMCFLPQLIGYNYFINSGSTLSSEKSDAEILHMARNAQAIIEDALDYGLYVNSIIICLAFVLSRYLSFPNVKMETRIKIRDIFEPYLKMTTPIPDGRFVEPFNTLMNVLPYEILLNIKRFEQTDGDVPMNGFEVLKTILGSNKDSHYGRRYHFEDILTPRGYQSQVPVTSVAAYQPMIDVEKSIGDSSVYAQSKPQWYIRLMNDMDVPVSAKQAEGYGDALKKQLHGKTVLVWSEDSNPIFPANNGVYTSTVSGITYDEYSRKYRYDLAEASRYFVLPAELLFDLETGSERSAQALADRNYVKLLLCAAKSDIDQIVLFGSFDLGSMKSGLEESLCEIADDIEAGTLQKPRTLPEAVARKVAFMLRPDPQRAQVLRELAGRAEGFTLRDVWNDLAEITMICVHPTPEQRTDFEGIPFRCRVLATEFGILGTDAGQEGVFTLCRDTIFYEFLPVGASAEERPVLCEALHTGDKVKPVITTDAGLYRLPLSLTLEIVGIDHGNILFRPCR